MLSNGEESNFADIDKNRLDEECVLQPRLFREWADKLAKARHRAALARANLELVEAEQHKAVRQHPSKYGLDDEKKPTEKAVEAAVVLSEAYQAALKEKIQADYLAEVTKVAVDTIGYNRKKCLEDLIQLRLADYYAEPSVKAKRETTGENASKRAFGYNKKHKE